MSRKLYLILSGAIFLLVALLHLFRLQYRWPIVVGAWVMFEWMAYFGFPVASAYCIWADLLYRDSRSRRSIACSEWPLP